MRKRLVYVLFSGVLLLGCASETGKSARTAPEHDRTAFSEPSASVESHQKAIILYEEWTRTRHEPYIRRSLDILRRECRAGSDSGCLSYFGVLKASRYRKWKLDGTDVSRAVDLCSGRYGAGCTIAWEHRKLLGKGWKGIIEGIAYQACSMGYLDYCTYMYKKAEKARDWDGMVYWGAMKARAGVKPYSEILDGYRVLLKSPDLRLSERTVSALESLCLLGMESACFYAAVARHHGWWGVSRDDGKAARFLDVACKSGMVTACYALKYERFLHGGKAERTEIMNGLDLMIRSGDRYAGAVHVKRLLECVSGKALPKEPALSSPLALLASTCGRMEPLRKVSRHSHGGKKLMDVLSQGCSMGGPFFCRALDTLYPGRRSLLVRLPSTLVMRLLEVDENDHLLDLWLYWDKTRSPELR